MLHKEVRACSPIQKNHPIRHQRVLAYQLEKEDHSDEGEEDVYTVQGV